MNDPVAFSQLSSASDAGFAELVEQLTARLHAGEVVDLDGCLRDHPEHAERLGRLLPALRLLAEVSRSRPDGLLAESAGDRAEPLVGTLGDFRILREVGRGGMGLVYEAQQISLGRRVALKVLPYAATMDARQLQRFQNESRAAASLEHPHIVPVYGVGCERAVHFYAMRFIEGQSLAELIAALRQIKRREHQPATPPEATVDADSGQIMPSPSGETPKAGVFSTVPSTKDATFFRTVAQLGIQAAEALDHAHQVGIIHRDIKPANLMADASGHLWVTDFGLAQVRGDTRLTMTGDLVGTLRYMSPEQALAKRVVVDHRSDVYSLGATLYELLTLEPAYQGNDRQELLRQISFEEPTPPRRVNKRIPAELETIVLKALEKNPADRYASAGEIADDLHRFIKDEPIRARRPSLLKRGIKWTRRHKPLALAAASLLAAALVVAAVLAWVAHDRATRRAMITGRVEETLRIMDQLCQEDRWPEALQLVRHALGLLDSGPVDPALQERVRTLAVDLELVDDLQNAHMVMATTSRAGRFDWESADEAWARAFQKAGLDFEVMTVEEAGERLRRSSVATELAAHLDHWAVTRARIRPKDDLVVQHLRRIARIADPDEWRNRLRDLMARDDRQALVELAQSAEAASQAQLTLALLGLSLLHPETIEQAIAVFQLARLRHPENYFANHNLADALFNARPPRVNEALGFLTAALAVRPQSPVAHSGLGFALVNTGRFDEAIAELQEAIRIKKDEPRSYIELGYALMAKGRRDEALDCFREAIRLMATSSARRYSPLAHVQHGIALAELGRQDEAIAEFQEAIRLNKGYPEAHYNLGLTFYNTGRPDQAIAEYQEAIRLKKDDPVAHDHLGRALMDKGRVDEAIAEHKEALRLKKDSPEAHTGLGYALWAKGRPDEAIAEYREAIRLKKNDAEAYYNLGWMLHQMGRLDEAITEFQETLRLKKDHYPASNNLGIALAIKGRANEAIVCFKEAIRLQKDNPEAHGNLGNVLKDTGRLDEAIAEYREALRLKKDEPRAQQNLAITLQWKVIADKLPRILKGDVQPADAAERIALAAFCQQPFKGLNRAAFRFYSEAFAEQPQLTDDLNNQHRYNAACAAALAGCGQGQDAGKLEMNERAHLRTQAMDWLEADLKAYRQLLAKPADKAGPAVAQRLQHWRQDADFTGVRGDGLKQLPEAERQRWQVLWTEVESLRRRAAGLADPAPDTPELVPPPKELP